MRWAAILKSNGGSFIALLGRTRRQNCSPKIGKTNAVPGHRPLRTEWAKWDEIYLPPKTPLPWRIEPNERTKNPGEAGEWNAVRRRKWERK